MGRSGKWWIVDCPPQLAFILLNPFQIQEKLERAIFSASLICLKSNLLLGMTQCQKMSFQSGLVAIIFCSFFLFPVNASRLYWDPSTFFSAELFFPQLHPAFSFELLLYHVLLFSLQHALCKGHRDTCFPPKQVFNSSSTYIYLSMRLLTSDLRSGFHEELYLI